MGKVFFVALTVCASFFRGLDIFCYVSVNVAGSPARGLCLNIDKRPCQMPTDHRLQTSSCLYNHTSAYPGSSPKIKWTFSYWTKSTAKMATSISVLYSGCRGLHHLWVGIFIFCGSRHPQRIGRAKSVTRSIHSGGVTLLPLLSKVIATVFHQSSL